MGDSVCVPCTSFIGEFGVQFLSSHRASIGAWQAAGGEPTGQQLHRTFIMFLVFSVSLGMLWFHVWFKVWQMTLCKRCVLRRWVEATPPSLWFLA